MEKKAVIEEGLTPEEQATADRFKEAIAADTVKPLEILEEHPTKRLSDAVEEKETKRVRHDEAH